MAQSGGRGLGGKISSFLWWSYPRASLEYDVMVGLILAFIFLVPRGFFHDQPRPFPAPGTTAQSLPVPAAAVQITVIALPHGHYYQVIARQPQPDLARLLAHYTGHEIQVLGQQRWQPSVDGPVIYGVWTR
ncbi:MAG: hypothetical protein ACRD2E_00105 [Terriglobales bacterium]